MMLIRAGVCVGAATAAFWLSQMLLPLFVFMPMALCCTAKGIHGQDTSVLVPMMPMGGGDGDPKVDEHDAPL